MNNKIRISIIGTGHLGKIHCKLLANNSLAEFIGVFDANIETAKQVAKEYNIVAFSDIQQAVDAADAVIIVVPTSYHLEIAKLCLAANKHCFIEKPVTSTFAEAKELISISKLNPTLKIQVGHIERFNPAIRQVLQIGLEPLFVEAHRLSVFQPRAIDVSVIYDLMIHDIDLVLWLINSPIRSIEANGVAVITNTIDIANARINFVNGAVANITASRISAKPMRKIRFFQKNCYISIDLAKPDLEIYKLNTETLESLVSSGQSDALVLKLHIDKMIKFEKPEIIQTNAIADEQTSFINSIINDTETLVTLEVASTAVAVAEEISNLAEDSLESIK